MHNRVTQLGGAALAALALASSASADVKLNENFSVGGYAAGSYRYTDESDTDRFDMDAAKLAFNTNFSPVTGTASVYYMGGNSGGDDLTLLDAYVTYDAGNGVTITGGKFLSYLGYEAFDIPNMSQISYANGDFLGLIPGYHTGVKIGYSSGAYSAGVALLDSVFSGTRTLKGDGELKNNVGTEVFVQYTGIENLTLWGGIAYQSEGDFVRDSMGMKSYGPLDEDGFATSDKASEEVVVYDFWASYVINPSITIAGEYAFQESYSGDGYNWLAYLNYAANEKISTTFRISGEDVDNGPSFTKYTIAPAYKITDNLLVRGEVSFYSYDDYSLSEDTFVGVQAVFKF